MSREILESQGGDLDNIFNHPFHAHHYSSNAPINSNSIKYFRWYSIAVAIDSRDAFGRLCILGRREKLVIPYNATYTRYTKVRYGCSSNHSHRPSSSSLYHLSARCEPNLQSLTNNPLRPIRHPTLAPCASTTASAHKPSSTISACSNSFKDSQLPG